MIKNFVSNLLYLVPRELRHEICRHHSNKKFAENRSDFRTNGELWLLQNVLPDSQTVFDVGAFTGDWALEALRLNPNIDLHCFEPFQGAYEILEQKLSAAQNVTCNPFGLGSEDAKETLYVYDFMSEGNSLYLRRGIENIAGRYEEIKTRTVDIRTLDGYCREMGIETIDFIKIDVEGHEFFVAKGARRLFERNRINVMQFEYGGAYIDAKTLLRDFFEFFEKLDYTFYLLYPGRVRLVPRYDQRLENFQYKNFIVVNKSAVQAKSYFQTASTV